jgi:hypothetical protein
MVIAGEAGIKTGKELQMNDAVNKKYASFAEFFSVYLSEHANRACRRLHFIGSTLVLACLAALVVTGNPWFVPAAAFCGYGFAWLGHFGFEKNRPATFIYPLYSLMGDWVMYWKILTGKIPF